MNISNLPDQFFQSESDKSSELNVFNYEVTNSCSKNKINMSRHVFSFLMEGQKEVHFSNKSVSIKTNESLLIASGNFLMTEHIGDKYFRCLLFFFSPKNIEGFFLKYPQLIPAGTIDNGLGAEPFFLLEKDAFIIDFINSLSRVFHWKKPILHDMLRLKFEEIMLYLAEKYSHGFLNYLRSLLVDERNLSFQTTVEKNIRTNLNLEEIAFLCNMSLSTFKRQFLKIYRVSPGKWFQRMRLTEARAALSSSKVKPSDIFMDFGYENLSNFSAAFKNEFGYSPKQVHLF